MNELLFQWKQFSTLHKDNPPPPPDIDVNCFPSFSLTNQYYQTRSVSFAFEQLERMLRLSLSLSVLIFIEDGRLSKLCLEETTRRQDVHPRRKENKVDHVRLSFRIHDAFACKSWEEERKSHYFGRYAAKDFAFFFRC